jgi:hypothetical protein
VHFIWICTFVECLQRVWMYWETNVIASGLGFIVHFFNFWSALPFARAFLANVLPQMGVTGFSIFSITAYIDRLILFIILIVCFPQTHNVSLSFVYMNIKTGSFFEKKRTDRNVPVFFDGCKKQTVLSCSCKPGLSCKWQNCNPSSPCGHPGL